MLTENGSYVTRLQHTDPPPVVKVILNSLKVVEGLGVEGYVGGMSSAFILNVSSAHI